jgi:hypothetical protein
MKILKNSLLTLACLFVATASFLDAAKIQKVLVKNADGSTVDVTDKFANAEGAIESGDQELVVTTEDGSVVTIVPNSSVVIGTNAEGTTQVTVVAGAVIASSTGASISVSTVAGTFTTTGGDLLVAQSTGGENDVTVQAVNSSGGDVVFAPSDASAGNAPVSLQAGQEASITGKSDGTVFVAAQPPAIATATPATIAAVQTTAKASVVAVVVPPSTPAPGPAPIVVQPVVIDIPVADTEIASNPG